MLGAAIGSMIGQGVKDTFQMGEEIYGLARNAWLQDKTWEREDSAVQRRVADLRAAGLSPTLAAGNAASTQAPIRAQEPGFGNMGANIPMVGLQIEQARAQLSNTLAQNKLIQAQALKTATEAAFMKDINPEKLQAQKNINEFNNATMEDRIKMVTEKLNTQQKITMLRDVEYDLKAWERDSKLPVAIEYAARIVERASKEALLGAKIDETAKRILVLQVTKDYLEGRNKQVSAQTKLTDILRKRQEKDLGWKGPNLGELLETFFETKPKK